MAATFASRRNLSCCCLVNLASASRGPLCCFPLFELLNLPQNLIDYHDLIDYLVSNGQMTWDSTSLASLLPHIHLNYYSECSILTQLG